MTRLVPIGTKKEVRLRIELNSEKKLSEKKRLSSQIGKIQKHEIKSAYTVDDILLFELHNQIMYES